MSRTNYETFLTPQVIQFDLNSEQFFLVSDSAGPACLTPNLKQVVSGQTILVNNTYVPYMGIVSNPNGSAETCDFEARSFHLTTLGFILAPPNWANHRLGPVDGSVCDSLGLDDETVITDLPELHFKIYPNPGKNILQLETDIHLPFQLIIRNSQGSSVIEKEINTPHFILQDEVNSLSTGSYQVEVGMEKQATTGEEMGEIIRINYFLDSGHEFEK